MKISFITTVNHNVGDDFVREGIKFLLKESFKDENIDFIEIHKHCPITTRRGFEKIRSYKINKFDKFLPVNQKTDKVTSADIVVQSGAPVYWCHPYNNSHCHTNEWYEPLINRRFKKHKENKKLLNIAAGTCQPFNSDGSEFCEECKKHISEFYNLSDVTTLRDSLSQKIFSSLDTEEVPSLIPCTSIFAADEHSITSKEGEYIIMNFMPNGAHYTLNQNIDGEKWRDSFKKLYYKIKEEGEKVIIACHNQKEFEEAKKIDPSGDIFYKKDDYVAYMELYSKAKFGIVNRVHASFMLASLGKPSIAIGNDTRVKMVKEIDLKYYYINDINFDVLISEYERLKKDQGGYATKMKSIKEKAFIDYKNIFSKVI